MSQENVEIAHEAVRCFNDEDWDGLASLFAPDAVMTPVENWPEPGPFRGREAIVHQFQRLLGGYAQSDVAIEQAIEHGDWVITRYRWVVRATGSEIPIESRLTSVMRSEDGLSTELHFRFDHDAALEAAGLSEQAMSQENVEIVRRLYPGTMDVVALVANPKAAVDAVEPLLHPDFEAVGAAIAMPGIDAPQEAGRRVVRGVDGFIEGWRDFLVAWESWVVTPTEFIDVDGERVLIMLDIRARSKTHQVEIPIEAANLITVRDGKLARLEMFSGQAEALQAAGLSE